MLIIFDCDGVLIDSEILYAAVDADFLKQFGIQVSPAELSRRFAGVPHEAMLNAFSTEFGMPLSQEIIDASKLLHRRCCEFNLKPIFGAAEALKTLHKRGHEICVASSTATEELVRNLRNAGLLELVHPHLYSVSHVKRGKPAPDLFLYALSQMSGKAENAVVVEDSVAGVIAARSARISVVGFVGGAHADETLGGRLIEAGAERIFETMETLVDWIDTKAQFNLTKPIRAH